MQAANTSIESMRRRIIDLMKATRDLELGQYANASTLRYYKMTNSEYDLAKSQLYIFSIFLGDAPGRDSKTEGFTYDIRTLLQEKFIVLNAQVCYLPFPLSEKRWNYLMTNYSSEMRNLTYQTGKFTFPLYMTELIHILKEIKSSPILCCTPEGFSTITETLEQLKSSINLTVLADDSSVNRFGSVKIAESSVSSQPTIPAVVIQEEDRVNSIVNSVEKDLRDLQIDDVNIYSKLKSDDNKKYILDMIQKGSDDSHITSVLISDALDTLLLPIR